MKIIKDIIPSLKIFCYFLWRDIYIYRKKLLDNIINYSLLYPLIYAVSFVYLQSSIYFTDNSTFMGTLIFAGTIMLPIMVLTYEITFALLFDLEQDRFIDYQIILLSPRLVLLERIVFATLFSFFLTIPYFPVSKLLLGSRLDLSTISWPALLAILLFGSFCFASYQLLAACILKSNQLRTFWSRVNGLFITFGGFWIPLETMAQYSTILGICVQGNPALYLTEGVRQAILQRPIFFPLSYCVFILCIMSVFCILCSWYFFKKRTDHI
ncbi:MAG: hypothetical protein WCD44_01640 [Candidatus Babeliales bacterium]